MLPQHSEKRNLGVWIASYQLWVDYRHIKRDFVKGQEAFGENFSDGNNESNIISPRKKCLCPENGTFCS